MKKIREFNFSKARRVTPQENQMFREAIEKTFHIKRRSRGRPPKEQDKYQDIHIRLHPKAIQWARTQAKKKGIGYQTIINETLLHHAA
ncbi:MAG: AT hook motif protein [Elusimicrobia bacterium RIFCSPLOWO2_02_FULL_39_32]|nr:MAG: AT hook motif protein [Elusimicrobia bacterium RIFCSPHIGHO2_02_FULL_39_36]OGR91284.1 MAG: AT hook motif protein [Elusimicrobia bacterium RIFCSPLOWO2_02_FULL_39_32]OGS00658.1 MAG: AT hook motif protein [Elusimicrobia bacterium RIFCSPLOWO2_12_FULL_39_28]HLD79457.1 BrnA antitoxin family protein [Candidatus Nanoarchaeia archaeon]